MTRLAAALAAALALLPAAARAQDQHQHQHGAPAKGPAAAPSKAAAEAPAKGAITVTVTEDGWAPDRIRVKAGEKVRLVVTRKTERTCATELVIKELGVDAKLPLNQPVTVELTPTKSGILKYACSMGHVTGTLIVQ